MGFNAAAMALAHAGIVMKEMVASVAIGKIDDKIATDITKEEEDYHEGEGATDFAIAKVANSDEFSLLQLDGKIQPEVLKEVIEISKKSCEEIYEVQKKALKAVVEQEMGGKAK